MIGVNILRDVNKGELSFQTNSQYRGQLRDTPPSTAIVDLAEPAQEDLSVLGQKKLQWLEAEVTALRNFRVRDD